jgi:hypothetical protein
VRKSAIAAALALTIMASGQAAYGQAKTTRFANCTAMHKTYRGGVARAGAKDHRASGHAKYAPKVSTALYNANSKMDRDHDGVACEQ